jgi:hypothetical protein
MTVFYDASQSQSIPLPSDALNLSPKNTKTYEIRHDGENPCVYVRDKHGFEQLLRPRPKIKRLATCASALGLVSISTSDTANAAKALLEDHGIIQLPAVEVMRLKKLQKTVRTVAQVITETLQESHVRYKATMVTLTYRPDVKFQPRQVTEYIKCVRMWAKRRGYFAYYVWVMELTKRGVPHYHIVWFLPKGVTLPKADKQGWWKYGMTNTVFARSPVGYLCKYTSKGIDHNSWGLIPKGSRLHGNGGISTSMRLSKIWHLSPLWVRQSVSYDEKVKKIGAYWVNQATGMGQRSPWLYCWRSRVIKFVGFGDLVHVDDFRISEDTKPLWIPKDVMDVMAKAAMTAMDIHFEAIDRAFDSI